MKAHRQAHEFTPVVITLETQAEVDHLRALFESVHNCPEGSPLQEAYVVLKPYEVDEGKGWRDILSQISQQWNSK